MPAVGSAARRSLIALAGGALWGLCFGREPLALASWLALVPLILLLGARRPALSGWLFGFGFWLTSLYWIGPTLAAFGGLPVSLAWLCALGLAAFLAQYFLLFSWLGSKLWRRGVVASLLGLPALWVALEWLRAHLYTGFPWNLAAYAWIEIPGALPLSAWIGAYGVSFLVVAAAVAAALGWKRRDWRSVAAVWGLILTALAWGARWGGGAPPATSVSREAAPVRLIQPNIPNLVDPAAPEIAANYRRLQELTREACDLSGALVVWPESAGWPFSYFRDPQLRRDAERVSEQGCSLLFNSNFETQGAVFNSALLAGEDGGVSRYDKRHLVPYGEYVPLARWLPFMRRLARSVGDFQPGERIRLLPWGKERLGLAICFEIIFPEEVAAGVREGATVLATLANDAWYGDTSAPWQHLRAARFRAAESRRPLLRATITGVSAVIGADGSVLQSLGLGDQGILRARVAGRDELSPYTRAPWLAPLLCSLVAGFAILLARRS